MDNKVVKLNSANFESETSNGVVLVDFWAIWCGPCKMLASVIDELAGEYDGKAKIAKVNVDEEDELSAKYGVMNIPTMVILKNGVEVDRIVGFRPKMQISEIINKHLA